MLKVAGRGPALLAALVYLCRVIYPLSCVSNDAYRRPSQGTSQARLSTSIHNDHTKNNLVYPAMLVSHELLNLPAGLEVPHESLIDLLSRRQEFNNSIGDPGTNVMLKNMKLLRNLVADEDEHRQLATNQQPVSAPISGKKHNASLDEDINTINVLIGMLMMANRRLVEQRDKLLAGKTRRQLDFPETTKPNQLAGHQRALPDLSVKLAPMKKSADLFNGSSFWSLASAHPAARQVSSAASKLDHVLVRPGFNSATARASRVGEKLSASRHSATATVPSRSGELPMMYPHKPIVAHDLLHVNRAVYSDEVPGGADYGNPQRARHLFYEQLDRRLANPKFPHLVPTHQLQENSMVPPYNGYPFVHPLYGSPHVTAPGFSGADTPIYSGQHYPPAPLAPLHLKELAESQKAAAEERERRQREQALEVELRQVGPRQEHDRLRNRPATITTTERPAQQTTDSGSDEPPVSQSPGAGEENNGMDEESLNELKQSLPGGLGSDDFTDLFPPGILSEADIKEMRRQQQQQNHDNDKEEPSEEQQEDQPEAEGPNGLNEQSANEQPASSGEPPETPAANQNSSSKSADTPVASHGDNSTSTTSSTGRISGDSLSVAVNRGATRFMPNLASVNGGAKQPALRVNKTRRSQDSRLSREQVGAVVQLAARHLPGPLYLTEALPQDDNQLSHRGRERGREQPWTDRSTQPTLTTTTLNQSFDEELM